MANGVTIVDPSTTYIDAGVRIGADAVIRPLTFLEGDTRIGKGAAIGPSTRIVDSRVGDDAEVTFSVVLGSRVGARAIIGPFARLRPGVDMGERTKAGAFVDLKAVRIGAGAKVPHLAYVGDAVVGKDANVGAGTITVNYDGYEKRTTVIGEGARIGSDTMLIAPVKIGRNANTGAGSVITKNVPAGALGVERSEQHNVKGYRARKDAERKGKR
jgi:bifunctional UDP-N-acetylglucosamine pyrophosphorylase/glucosamine-1-phosphate N-acetyltransferase